MDYGFYAHRIYLLIDYNKQIHMEKKKIYFRSYTVKWHGPHKMHMQLQ